jgi:hypothetical protein
MKPIKLNYVKAVAVNVFVLSCSALHAQDIPLALNSGTGIRLW